MVTAGGAVARLFTFFPSHFLTYFILFIFIDDILFISISSFLIKKGYGLGDQVKCQILCF